MDAEAADVNMLAAEVALDRETSHCTEQGGYRSLADHSLTFRALQRFTMVAHFVCALFTGYVVYTSHQPTSSEPNVLSNFRSFASIGLIINRGV